GAAAAAVASTASERPIRDRDGVMGPPPTTPGARPGVALVRERARDRHADRRPRSDAPAGPSLDATVERLDGVAAARATGHPQHRASARSLDHGADPVKGF